VPVIKSISFALAFSAITFLHIVLGGTSPPKFSPSANPWLPRLFVSAPLRWFYAIFKPAIGFLNAASNWVLAPL